MNLEGYEAESSMFLRAPAPPNQVDIKQIYIQRLAGRVRGRRMSGSGQSVRFRTLAMPPVPEAETRERFRKWAHRLPE